MSLELLNALTLNIDLPPQLESYKLIVFPSHNWNKYNTNRASRGNPRI